MNIVKLILLQCVRNIRIARNADRCNSHRNSVYLSVRASITFRCFVQANEDTIVRFSASGGTIIIGSEEVMFIRIFAEDHSQRGR